VLQVRVSINRVGEVSINRVGEVSINRVGEVSINRVGGGGLRLPEPERGKVWKPSQGFH
jgi:hypothetical protein